MSERKEILEQLADGQITVSEAERMLGEQGSPVTEPVVTRPPKRTSSNLALPIILLVGILVVPVILIGVVGMLFFFTAVETKRSAADQMNRITIEEMQMALEHEARATSASDQETRLKQAVLNSLAEQGKLGNGVVIERVTPLAPVKQPTAAVPVEEEDPLERDLE